jgi:hypothetical protein
MLFRALALLGLPLLCGCSRTADEEQCLKLVDKLVDLVADGSSEHVDKVKKDVKHDKRSAILSRETCVGKITRSQYDCMMAAKSLESFAACEK